MTVMAAALSEPLGPEQRVDEVDHGDIQHELILSTPTVIASKLLFAGHEIEPNYAC